MRVLLISANQERSPDPVAPLGAYHGLVFGGEQETWDTVAEW